MEKKFKVNGKTLKTDKRFSKVKLNLDGGGLQNIQAHGFKKIDCLSLSEKSNWMEQHDTVYKKDNKYYHILNYMHHNGHFSNMTEGVYEVTLQEIK